MAGDTGVDRDQLGLMMRAIERGASRDEVIELLCNGFGYTRRQAERSAAEALSSVANLELASGRRR